MYYFPVMGLYIHILPLSGTIYHFHLNTQYISTFNFKTFVTRRAVTDERAIFRHLLNNLNATLKTLQQREKKKEEKMLLRDRKVRRNKNEKKNWEIKTKEVPQKRNSFLMCCNRLSFPIQIP